MSKLLKRSVSVLVSVALVCAVVAANAGGDAYGRYSGTPTIDRGRSQPAELGVRRSSHALFTSTHQLRPQGLHAVIAARLLVTPAIDGRVKLAPAGALAVSLRAIDAHTDRGPPSHLLF